MKDGSGERKRADGREGLQDRSPAWSFTISNVPTVEKAPGGTNGSASRSVARTTEGQDWS